jgi:hypothetical protein
MAPTELDADTGSGTMKTKFEAEAPRAQQNNARPAGGEKVGAVHAMNAPTSFEIAGAQLSQPFTSEDHRRARETIIAALSATKTVRGRNSAGKIIYVQEPDWSTRLPAAVKVCEFVGGKPIAMTVTADLTKNGSQSPDDFFRDVQQDPEALRDMQDILGEYAKLAEKGHPINVTARSVSESGDEGSDG